MGSIDFDQVESNKFWKGIIADVLITAVIITLVICIYDCWQTAKMLASGYEYRRVPVSVETKAKYSYEWVKIGSPESKEATTIPERTGDE